MKALPIALSLAVALCMMCGASAAPLAEARLCFFLFTDVSDLGWTYAFNVARLELIQRLKAEFPATLINVDIHTGAVTRTAANRDALIAKMATVDNCTVVATNSNFVTRAHAVLYPSVSFISVVEAPDDLVVPPNHAPLIFEQFQPFYFMGVAAAHQARTAVCVIVAWAPPITAGAAANYFLAGVRHVNATLPAHVVTIGAWHNPQAEITAVKELIALGCDIVARSSDPFDVDRYVATLDTGSAAPVFSMGVHIRLQQFIGDTALASSVPDWVPTLLPLFRDVLRQGRLNGTATLGTASAVLEPWSARTAPAAVVAANTEVQRWGRAAGALICDGPYRMVDGTAAVTRNVTEGYAVGKQCIDDRKVTQFISYPNVVYHTTDKFADGAAECGRGTFYTYDASPRLTLRCVQCPAGTYRPLLQTTAAKECTKCPNGTTSDVGAVECYTPSAGSLSSPLIVGIAVIGSLSVALASAALVYVLCLHRRTPPTRRPQNAPSDPVRPFAIAFTDIQASTTLWARAPQQMGAAIDLHHTVLRNVIADHNGYEVKTIGDSFMVAFKEIDSAVSFSLAVQEALHDAAWETDIFDTVYHEQLAVAGSSSKCDRDLWCGIRVRVGLHYGLGDIKHDEASGGYDYYGTVVNTAARVEAVGHGGQVLLTEAAFDAMSQMSAAPSTSDLGPQPLRGLTGPVRLHQLLPRRFAGRRFPPLRLDQDTTLIDDGGAEQKSTASTPMGMTPTDRQVSLPHDVRSVSDSAARYMADQEFGSAARRLRLRDSGPMLCMCYRVLETALSTATTAAKTATVTDLANRWRTPAPVPAWALHAARGIGASNQTSRAAATDASLLLVAGRVLDTMESLPAHRPTVLSPGTVADLPRCDSVSAF